MVDSYEGQRIFFSDQNLQMDDEKTNKISYDDVLKKFKLFIREYQHANTYIYRYFLILLREELLTNLKKENYYIEFNFDDINAFDENLSNYLIYKPSEVVNIVRNFYNNNFFNVALTSFRWKKRQKRSVTSSP